jgi:hypothetical protein
MCPFFMQASFRYMFLTQWKTSIHEFKYRVDNIVRLVRKSMIILKPTKSAILKRNRWVDCKTKYAALLAGQQVWVQKEYTRSHI